MSSIIEVFQKVVDLTKEVKYRIDSLKESNLKAIQVKEDILKDAIESDNEVNADNYFKYSLDVQLRFQDIQNISRELLAKYELFLELETGMDFPVEAIEIINEIKEYVKQPYYKLSPNGTDLIPTNKEEIDAVKESALKMFEKGFNKEWIKLLE